MLTNDSFTWPVSFSCVVVIGDLILPNSYNLTISMSPASTQNAAVLGFKKVKQFINTFVHYTMIAKDDHPILSQFPLSISTNTIQLPQDPYDYFFSAVLFRKLSAITQNHLIIQHIALDSSVGDHIQYQVNSSCNAYSNVLDQENKWWNSDTLSTNHVDKFPSWETFDISTPQKFHPKIIKGGKCEGEQVR